MGYFINLRFGVFCGPLSYQKYLLASDTVFVTESTLFIKRCMRNVFPLRKQMANSWTAAKFQETKMKKNAFKPNIVKQIKSNEIKMAR